jgi:transcriptional regulator with XRE-family HTH domain
LGYVIQLDNHQRVSKTKFTQGNDVFRELLKGLRLGKNLTQAQVAERLRVPQSYVSKYETGERRLDFVETVFVCEALEVSVESFAERFVSTLGKVRGVTKAAKG